jgi:hypothetical protein
MLAWLANEEREDKEEYGLLTVEMEQLVSCDHS